MRPLTNSELATFRTCRRKWWLQYVRGLRRKEERNELLEIGTTVHKGLELLYKGQPLDAITDWMRDASLDLEPTMLEGYVQWVEETGADANLEIVETEVSRTVRWQGLELLSKADLRFVDTSSGVEYGVMDHKTVSSLGQYDLVAPIMTQPLHYMLVERIADSRPVQHAGRFVYNMLRRVKRTIRAKPPFYRRLDVYHTDNDLKSYAQRIKAQALEMGELERKWVGNSPMPAEAYPSPTQNCTWQCPFVGVCPQYDDNVADAETTVHIDFEEVDPLAHHRT